MKKFTLLVILSIAFLNTLFAQEWIKFSAQIRPRFEVDNKDFRSSTLPNTYTLLRTRLGLSFVPVKNLSGLIQLQDSRTFGEETNTTSNIKNLDLHQAFFKIENIFDLPVDIKIGRMEVSYGSERFIGAVNWNNIGRSFDGGIATLHFENFSVDAFAMKEFEKSNPGDSLDQSIYGVNIDIGKMKNYKIQPFLIWQRESPTDYLSRFTLGTYLKGDLENFVHEIDAAYQFGKILASNKKQTVSSFIFTYSASYSFDASTKPFVGAEVDYVSGDNNPFDDKYKSFASLYGTGHKFFGYMDYFVNFPNDTYGLGITDLVGKVGINPARQLKLNLNFHFFRANENYRLIDGSASKDFGTELDLTGNYKYNENVSFEGGASLFSPGKIFKERHGKDTATWFYLMSVINF